MIPQLISKKFISFFAILALAAQTLLAGELNVTNNSDAHLIVSFVGSEAPAPLELAPGQQSEPINLPLDTYKRNGSIAYRISLDMTKNNEERNHHNDPITKKHRVDWSSINDTAKVHDLFTFSTIKPGTPPQIISRDLSVSFKYDKKTDQLNMIIQQHKRKY